MGRGREEQRRTKPSCLEFMFLGQKDLLDGVEPINVNNEIPNSRRSNRFYLCSIMISILKIGKQS